jgi:RNA polymerase sigma-70 factor (ECF subfamily)
LVCSSAHDIIAAVSSTVADIVREVRPELELPDGFAAGLDARIAAARAAWPDVRIEPERFARFVAARLEPPLDAGLSRLQVEDLYLACACTDGAPGAVAAFERAFVPVIERAATAAGARRPEVDDLRQVVCQRLLVPAAVEDGTPAEPRIATYSGRGDLGSWVRVVATREAQRLLPRERRELPSDDDLAGLIAPDDDPEVGYLKRLYRAEFKQAFAAAITGLSDRERLLLHQHALDGLGIDDLAGLYKVHRATAARWLEAARHSVLVATRRELTRKLQLSKDELERVMALIASQLSVSLPRLLSIRAS